LRETYSKPANGSPKTNYDGQQIMVDGKATYKDIPVQAKAGISYIKKTLNGSTGSEC